MTDQNNTEETVDREKMIDRVRKLFNMSNDTSSIHEAEIALRRCHSLMKKYGITEADLTTSEFGTGSAYTAKTMEKWKKFLSLGIAAFTNTICVIERAGDYDDLRQIKYSGFDADVLNAVLLSEYLEETLDRCVKAYKKETKNTGKAASTSFKNGFALALQERMMEMAEEVKELPEDVMSDGTSLVVCKMKLVTEEFGKQKIRRQSGGTSDSSARNAGERAGRNVNLNRQINGGGNNKALNAA